MNAITHIKTRRAERNSLRARVSWRNGFLAAVDRRLFDSLPPYMQDSEQYECQRDPAFAEGFKHGMTCPLATRLPEEIQEQDYETMDQYKAAGYVSAALIGAIVMCAWFISVNPV